MHLAVTGYASLDYAVQLAGDIVPDQTTHARRASKWPRAGGCPFYIGRAAAQGGHRISPITWLGSDDAADVYREALTGAGMVQDGVSAVPDARSPAGIMAYQADGRCACLYDPGPAGLETLTDQQAGMLNLASHICLSVGPGALIDEILAARNPSARLYWAVKDDPSCFTPQVRAVLAEIADVIFFSSGERHLVPETRAICVETLGAGGVRLTEPVDAFDLPVTPLECDDTTGAGDTLAGGYIAGEMAGANPREALEAGVGAVARMLKNRKKDNA